MLNFWKVNWLKELRVIKIFIIFDLEILFLGLNFKEIVLNIEKDVCFGVIYNSKNVNMLFVYF